MLLTINRYISRYLKPESTLIPEGRDIANFAENGRKNATLSCRTYHSINYDNASVKKDTWIQKKVRQSPDFEIGIKKIYFISVMILARVYPLLSSRYMY